MPDVSDLILSIAALIGAIAALMVASSKVIMSRAIASRVVAEARLMSETNHEATTATASASRATSSHRRLLSDDRIGGLFSGLSLLMLGLLMYLPGSDQIATAADVARVGLVLTMYAGGFFLMVR